MIPVIISGVEEKFKSWRKLMGELRQHHPRHKISTIKELPKGDFLAIGDSLQDVTVLQNEKKMNAVLGKNVKISFSKAFQISKEQIKSLPVKGVPTDMTDNEFKESLNLNKYRTPRLNDRKAKRTIEFSHCFVFK